MRSLLRRTLTLGLVAAVATASAISLSGQASDPEMGTWRLNVAESKFDPGPSPQSQILKQEPWEGGLKQTFDTVNAQGQAFHQEIIAKFDGEDRGAQPADTRAFRRIDDHTIEWVNKTNGQVTFTNRIVISADGKTMTQTTTGKSAQGQAVNNVIVRAKQ